MPRPQPREPRDYRRPTEQDYDLLLHNVYRDMPTLRAATHLLPIPETMDRLTPAEKKFYLLAAIAFQYYAAYAAPIPFQVAVCEVQKRTADSSHFTAEEQQALIDQLVRYYAVPLTICRDYVLEIAEAIKFFRTVFDPLELKVKMGVLTPPDIADTMDRCEKLARGRRDIDLPAYSAAALDDATLGSMLIPVNSRSSGFPDIDALIGRLRDGDTTLLTGHPGGFKSTLGLQIAYHCAAGGTPAWFISLEMPPPDLWRLLLCIVASIDRTRMHIGRLSPTELSSVRAARDHIRNLPAPLTITPPTHFRATADLTGLIRDNPSSVFVLDHLARLGTKDMEDETEYSRMIRVSEALLDAAQAAPAHVIALQHINKGGLNRMEKAPGGGKQRALTMSDSRGSVLIAGTFVNALTMVRPTPQGSDLIVECEKARYGPCGRVYLHSMPSTGRIWDGFNPPKPLLPPPTSPPPPASPSPAPSSTSVTTPSLPSTPAAPTGAPGAVGP